MKRRPSGSMTLSETVFGFVNHKFAEGLTERSVNSYERLLSYGFRSKNERRG